MPLLMELDAESWFPMPTEPTDVPEWSAAVASSIGATWHVEDPALHAQLEQVLRKLGEVDPSVSGDQSVVRFLLWKFLALAPTIVHFAAFDADAGAIAAELLGDVSAASESLWTEVQPVQLGALGECTRILRAVPGAVEHAQDPAIGEPVAVEAHFCLVASSEAVVVSTMVEDVTEAAVHLMEIEAALATMRWAESDEEIDLVVPV